MLPDLIATVILAGMMLIPLVNVIAAVVIGSVIGGAPGALAGICLAVAIMGAERWVLDWIAERSTPVAKRTPPTRVEPALHAAPVEMAA